MTKKNNIDLVVVGHLCLDIIPLFTTKMNFRNISNMLEPGTLIDVGEICLATGGCVANVGIAMKTIGFNVAFMSKVGNDIIGSIIVDILREEGSIEGICISSNEKSSYTIVISPPNIDRMFLHFSGANATFKTTDIDFSIVENARLFHLGYPTLMRSLFRNNGIELASIFKLAKECGATTSLDISMPDPGSEAGRANWREIYEKCLKYVDVFLPSIEEVLFTLEPNEYLRRKEQYRGHDLVDYVSQDEFTLYAEELIKMGCRIVVIKAGHKGLYVKSSNENEVSRMGNAAPKHISNWSKRELWCPAFQASKYIGATGAGDCTIAGFLAGLLRDQQIEKSMKIACCAGYLSLRKIDSSSGLKPWDEIIQLMSSLAVCSEPVLEQGWFWRTEAKLWEKEL